ncbi:MAG: hypothetical protein V4615_03745 [Bacteroidota bacterium]
MEDEIQRDYPGADYYLMEQSQLLKDLLTDDLADFTAFDLEFVAAFLIAWQTAIDDAVNYTDDNIVSAQIVTEGVSVNIEMQNCMNKYHDIMYFAAKAFGKRSTVLREFGQGTAYRKAVKSQERMFGFMDEFSKTAIKYTAELTAKGCPPAFITGIATVRDALNTTNRSQNLSIKARPVISQGRVIVYNALYTITRLVIDAAQNVYRTNPAKRAVSV